MFACELAHLTRLLLRLAERLREALELEESCLQTPEQHSDPSVYG